MSREILFRAKRANWKELPKSEWWVEGYLMDENYINIPFNDDAAGSRFDEPIEIDPETVCEYTGLPDKTSRKIFEGDIIQFDDTGEEGYEYKEGFDFINRAKVVWNKGKFELDSFLSNNSGILETMYKRPEEFYDMFEYYAEVIGNIFDNPELLEGEVSE